MPFKYLIDTWIGDLLNERNEQISHHSSQINIIQSHQKKCPETIIKFLIEQQRLNMIRTDRISNRLAENGIFCLRESISQNLKEVESDLKKIESIIESGKICQGLEKFVSDSKKSEK